MSILESLEWRYATKKFDGNRILPKEKIDLLKNAFNLTATSYGLQPVRLLVIEDKKLQESLVAHSWNQRQVADASHVLVFCIENDLNEDTVVRYFDRVKTIRETPDEILRSFRDFLVDDFEKKTAEELKAWATKQAYLCMGNLLTVCAVEGIDACPMEGFVPEKYDELLGLDALRLQSVLVMPVGYRAEDDMFAGFKKVRKDLTDSVVEL